MTNATTATESIPTAPAIAPSVAGQLLAAQTLSVDPGEVRTLQLALQGANANMPNAPGLATLTAKVAALVAPGV